MSTYKVQNVLGSKESGYIDKYDLEMFLEKRFPRDKFPGPAKDRFHIRVSACFSIQAEPPLGCQNSAVQN